MTLDQLIGVLSVLLAILTAAVAVLGGYVGYLGFTLRDRVAGDVAAGLAKSLEVGGRRIAAQAEALELALEILGEVLEEVGSRGRGDVYVLRHVLRTSSSDQEEVKRSLLALEAVGEAARPYYSYVERFRRLGDWESANQVLHDRLIRSFRQEASRVRVDSKAKV